VTSPVNTGFFERQPVYKPVTNLCTTRDKGTAKGGLMQLDGLKGLNELKELHGLHKFHGYNGVVMAGGVSEVWNANVGRKKRNDFACYRLLTFRRTPGFQGIALRAKILFLNLAQVGAIKCKWYRIRHVEGGKLSKGKKFSNFGMVRVRHETANFTA